MIKTSPHPLDHLVLPTRSLEIARQRLSSLGFVVAPTGLHPFGTENACVFFADGTYL
ncbi:VOC family protein, partial [Mesorhizobium sp. USDA-HM6]